MEEPGGIPKHRNRPLDSLDRQRAFENRTRISILYFGPLCYPPPAALDQGGSGAFARKGASTRFRGVDRFSKGIRRVQRRGTWRRSGCPVQLKSGEPRQSRKAATVTDIFRVPPVSSGEPATLSGYIP